MQINLLAAGFLTGVETWGELSPIGKALQNLMGEGGLELILGSMGGGLKMLLKSSCEGVYLLVKLPAISLQACKFTRNELLHTYFQVF